MAFVVTSTGIAKNFVGDELANADSGATPAYQVIRGQLWSAGAPVGLNRYIVPSDLADFDYLYQVTAVSGPDAVTGSSEPTWPSTIGDTVDDNGNTITCVSRREVAFYENGFITRDPEVGPAAILEDGTEIYYVNGRLQRRDGPAVDAADPANNVYADNKEILTDQVKRVRDILEGAVYTVNVEVDGNGSVALNPDQAEYDFNAGVEITATPDASNNFVGWTGDIESTDNPITVAVTKDLNIIAVFEAA